MDNLDNINGGLPPIQLIKFKETKKKEDKTLVKERGFTSNTVSIHNIIKTKKEDVILNKEKELEIIDFF